MRRAFVYDSCREQGSAKEQQQGQQRHLVGALAFADGLNQHADPGELEQQNDGQRSRNVTQ
ncbi:hypothetical protein D3C75_1328140 [compost metagenome]